MKKLFLRGHHLSTLANHFLDGENSISELIYPDTTRVYDAIIANPDLDIEIVEGFDSVCSESGAEECPDFKPSCVFPDALWNEDIETLKEYGVKTGENYCASDLLERFIDYKQEKGFKSPRCKFLFERGEQ